MFSFRKRFWKTNKDDWRPRRRTNKGTWKQSQKKILDTDQKSIKNFLNEKATYELNKIVEMENKLNRDNLISKTGNYKKDKTYDFQKFKTTRSFRREIYNNDLSLDDALELQIRLKDDIDIFKNLQNQKTKSEKKLWKMPLRFLMGCKKFLMLLKMEYF